MRKPVTLLTGYLGSGKTTLMNHLLEQEQDKKVAVIVNDCGAVNIDAALIRENGLPQENQMIELQNGCICCTLRDEFMQQVEEVCKMDTVDAVLVEASGISSPSSIAEAFLAYQVEEKADEFYLDSIVTVVDADRIYSEFLCDLEDNTDEQDADGDDPDIINLVVDQIEFCNVILLNKCDLLDKNQIERVKRVIRDLQPEAEIIETTHGTVNADKIVDRKLFDYAQVSDSSTTAKALLAHNQQEAGGHKENGVHAEYGITSFVYENRIPLDQTRFMEFVEQDYPETLIRAKGYIWFEQDNKKVQLFEQAGRNASVTPMSNWIAAFPEKERQEVFAQYPDVLDDWDEVYGDRMNQIVFIGRGYDQKMIEQRLNACLIR